jgi:hypothetical protein
MTLITSMLSNTLVTNEVKNSAGTELEFTRIGINGRSTEYAAVAELPAKPYRLKISHTESGTGINLRRRGVVRFDYSATGQVDTTQPAKVSAYVVLDSPIGNLTSQTVVADLLANLNSFMASLGASTTILYDGTGNGTAALLAGTL